MCGFDDDYFDDSDYGEVDGGDVEYEENVHDDKTDDVFVENDVEISPFPTIASADIPGFKSFDARSGESAFSFDASHFRSRDNCYHDPFSAEPNDYDAMFSNKTGDGAEVPNGFEANEGTEDFSEKRFGSSGAVSFGSSNAELESKYNRAMGDVRRHQERVNRFQSDYNAAIRRMQQYATSEDAHRHQSSVDLAKKWLQDAERDLKYALDDANRIKSQMKR